MALDVCRASVRAKEPLILLRKPAWYAVCSCHSQRYDLLLLQPCELFSSHQELHPRWNLGETPAGLSKLAGKRSSCDYSVPWQPRTLLQVSAMLLSCNTRLLDEGVPQPGAPQSDSSHKRPAQAYTTSVAV